MNRKSLFGRFSSSISSSRTADRPESFRARLEPLEKRQLLAIISFSDNWFNLTDAALSVGDTVVDFPAGVTGVYGSTAFGSSTNSASLIAPFNNFLTKSIDGVAFDMQYIQSSIAGASDGDVVTVLRGTYTESDIIINKGVTFAGEGSSGATQTLIVPEVVSAQGVHQELPDGAFNGIFIYSDNVTVRDLALDGSGNGSLAGGFNYNTGITTFFEQQNGPGGGAHDYTSIRSVASGLQLTMKLTTPVAISSETDGAPNLVINTAVPHGFSAGEEIFFDLQGGTLATGLVEGTAYYAGNVTATSFTVHPTSADGVAGTSAVAFVAAGSGVRRVMLRTYYGQATGGIDQSRLEPAIFIEKVQVENIWGKGIVLSAPSGMNFGRTGISGANEVADTVVSNIGSPGNKGPHHVGILIQNLDDYNTGDPSGAPAVVGGNAYRNTVNNAGIGIASNAYGVRSWNSRANARNDTDFSLNTVNNAVTAAYKMEFLSGGSLVGSEASFSPGNTAIGIHSIRGAVTYTGNTLGTSTTNAPFIGIKIEDADLLGVGAVPVIALIDIVGPGTTVAGSVGILADNTFGANTDTSFIGGIALNVSGFETGIVLRQSNAAVVPTTVIWDRLNVDGNAIGFKLGPNHANGGVVIDGQFNTTDAVTDPGVTILGQFTPGGTGAVVADALTAQPTPPGPSHVTNQTPPVPTISIPTLAKPDAIRTGNLTLAAGSVFTPILNGDGPGGVLVLEDFSSPATFLTSDLDNVNPWNAGFVTPARILWSPAAIVQNGDGFLRVGDGVTAFSTGAGLALSTTSVDATDYGYMQVIVKAGASPMDSPDFFLSLADLDGTSDLYFIPTADLTTTAFSTIRLNLLAPPIRFTDGDDVLNFSALAGWAIAGDFGSTDTNVTKTLSLVVDEIGFVAGPRASNFEVTGAVDLGGATLSPTTNPVASSGLYASSVGQTFTIVNNDAADAVVGTFAGLAEGAALTVAGDNYTISYVGGDGNDVVLTQVASPNSTIDGRFIFYNNSAFDTSAAIEATDDLAIDTSKTPYFPATGAAVDANITGYDKGINGIMIDLSAGPDHTSITAADFVFVQGNNNTPGTWAAAPAPSAVSVRVGAGVGGSDRVEVTWADGAITKKWLGVKMLANGNTTVAADDFFFWGNAVGDSGQGNTSTKAIVNATDEGDARAPLGDGHAAHNFFNKALVDDRADYNKDTFVTATDQNIARNNGTTFFTALNKINVASSTPFAPGGGVVSPATAGGGDAGISSGLASSSSTEESTVLPASVSARLAASSSGHGVGATLSQLLLDEALDDVGDGDDAGGVADELLDALAGAL